MWNLLQESDEVKRLVHRWNKFRGLCVDCTVQDTFHQYICIYRIKLISHCNHLLCAKDLSKYRIIANQTPEINIAGYCYCKLTIIHPFLVYNFDFEKKVGEGK